MKIPFLLAAAFVVASTQAQAATMNYVMDFSTGNVCADRLADNSDGPLRACASNFDTVALAYGDQPGVEVEWFANIGRPEQNRFNVDQIAGDAFAWANSPLFAATITLRALDGATVGLKGFDFAVAFLTVLGNNASGFTITDLAGVFDPITQEVGTTNVSLDRREFSFADLTSTVGIEILLGPVANSAGWGIDNIAYSVTMGGTVEPEPPVTPPSAIPLPPAGWLLLAGLGGLAALRRRPSA